MNSYDSSHQESELNYMEMNEITHSLSIVDQAILGKDITDVLFAILHHYGRISVSDVFNKVITMCDKAAMNFPALNNRNFLQSYPFLFSVNDRGYVRTVEEESALQLRIDTVEGTIAALLQVFFQDVPKIHISLLKESFCCFCSNIKTNLLQLQPIQQFYYLRENPAFLIDENDGLVEAIFMYRSNLRNVHQNVAKCDYKKLNVILNNKLKENSVCHYVTLFDTVLCSSTATSELKSFIEGLSNLEKLWFFRNRPMLYFVSNYGFVRLHNLVARAVVDFFLPILERHRSIDYSELVNILKNSACEFNEFFKFHSKKQIINFFRSRTTYFSVSEDFNIQPAQPLKTVKSKTVILKVGSLPLDSGYKNFEFGNEFEEEVVYGLLSILGSKRMKLNKLMQKSFRKFPSVLRFFEGYSSADESLFFMKHTFFNYDKSGFITAATNVIVPQRKGSIGHTKDAKQTAFTGINKKILEKRFFDILLPRKVYEILKDAHNKSMDAKKLLKMSMKSSRYFRYFLNGFCFKKFCSKLNPNMFTIFDVY